jgi:hypothetical protein
MIIRSRKQWEIDQALGGKLEKELRTRRARKESGEVIARWIVSTTGVPVSGRTVQSWCNDLEAVAS